MIKKDNDSFEFTRKELLYFVFNMDDKIQYVVDDEENFEKMFFKDLDIDGKVGIWDLTADLEDELYQKAQTYQWDRHD